MYILDIDKIKPGDIFLVSGNRIRSKSVRIATGSKYSHAILYVGGGSYIHADGTGVHAQNIQRLLLENSSELKVLRLKDHINKEHINKTCDFARTLIGTEYSVKEAITTKFKPSEAIKENRQFCSRLVAKSFMHADIQLVENTDYCSPEELNQSEELSEICNCLRVANEAEVAFSKDEARNPLKKQEEVTNDILQQARDLTNKDIQTFEQLTQFVLDNTQYDKQICEIFEQSGYLNLWEQDINNCPWRYEFSKFKEAFPDPTKRSMVAKEFLASEQEIRERFMKMSILYMQIQHLELGKLLLCLYQHLLDLSIRREAVYKVVIQNA